jgi:hypothetical protein
LIPLALTAKRNRLTTPSRHSSTTSSPHLVKKQARPFRGGPDNISAGRISVNALRGGQNTIPKPSALLFPSVRPNRSRQA